ncbi:hypothetical protein KCU81_g162, partial [Aureobasidium melanogenum]
LEKLKGAPEKCKTHSSIKYDAARVPNMTSDQIPICEERNHTPIKHSESLTAVSFSEVELHRGVFSFSRWTMNSFCALNAKPYEVSKEVLGDNPKPEVFCVSTGSSFLQTHAMDDAIYAFAKPF